MSKNAIKIRFFDNFIFIFLFFIGILFKFFAITNQIYASEQLYFDCVDSLCINDSSVYVVHDVVDEIIYSMENENSTLNQSHDHSYSSSDFFGRQTFSYNQSGLLDDSFDDDDNIKELKKIMLSDGSTDSSDDSSTDDDQSKFEQADDLSVQLEIVIKEGSELYQVFKDFFDMDFDQVKDQVKDNIDLYYDSFSTKIVEILEKFRSDIKIDDDDQQLQLQDNLSKLEGTIEATLQDLDYLIDKYVQGILEEHKDLGDEKLQEMINATVPFLVAISLKVKKVNCAIQEDQQKMLCELDDVDSID